ncbi:MAG: glycogen/starch synthase [Prevotellaceae bacterium]|jgi:starch synthase|nr:glycogen/starch synthase [Prevotellaceae bacterium]
MKKKVRRVLYISQEISPYLPETELSLIARQLPEDIQQFGWETRIFMPKYGSVNERRNQLHEVIRLSGMNLIIDDTDHPLILKVASIQAARMQIYFIDNDEFFHRKSIACDEDGKEFRDNDERAIFFARSVMETVKKLRWTPDIIHCHGWISSLIPIYVKKAYNDDPFFKHSKVIWSLLNDDFQQPFRKEFAKKMKTGGMREKDIAPYKGKELDYLALSKLAIDFSDGISQITENANQQLIDYVEDTEKPFLHFKGKENYITHFAEFYDNLMQ